LFTIGLSIFQVEGAVAEGLVAMGTGEAGRMPFLVQGVQTVRSDRLGALGTSGSNVTLEAALAVFLAILFHKATF
jgi:hypothetical protein